MNSFNHPEWTKNKNIYEVNLRQYTQEGTINAFMQHLSRLKKMGVDILWFMPIHPVGVINRKGTLGSQYASQNYTDIDPNIGTKEEFKHLVEIAHSMGMYILLDWVANHSAWDNVWVKSHLDWYKKDENGELYPYTFSDGKKVEYWDDVIGFDYQNKALWQGMTDAMAYWVKEFDIDGFRCDVAGLVPTEFWEFATDQLNKIKHLFMLAEWSTPELHRKAFDMTYDWNFYVLMGQIAKGEKTPASIPTYLEELFQSYPHDAYRMLFTTNHDKNTWEAHDEEYFGDSFKAFSVLAMTLYGMPLIYSGQEAWLNKRLPFFEKDPIDWKTYELENFYSDLLKLKRNNEALWNGAYGAMPVFHHTENEHVINFTRKKNANCVTVTINLSDKTQEYQTKGNQKQSIKAYEYVISTSM